jgi:hypothetical protein
MTMTLDRRRVRAGQLLALYLALSWVPVAYDLATGDTRGIVWTRGLLAFAVIAFIAWRVWLGGAVSWVLLAAVSIYGLVIIPVASAWPWNGATILGFFVSAVQLALVFTPPIRRIRAGQPAEGT